MVVARSIVVLPRVTCCCSRARGEYGVICLSCFVLLLWVDEFAVALIRWFLVSSLSLSLYSLSVFAACPLLPARVFARVVVLSIISSPVGSLLLLSWPRLCEEFITGTSVIQPLLSQLLQALRTLSLPVNTLGS